MSKKKKGQKLDTKIIIPRLPKQSDPIVDEKNLCLEWNQHNLAPTQINTSLPTKNPDGKTNILTKKRKKEKENIRGSMC